LSSEFTMARQRVSEDPNQFYLRLLNLGIQSDRSVHIEDYRTRLVKPLLTLINQQDRTYTRVQDLVGHAGRLWQTLDLNKLRQEIKEERSQRYQNYDRQDRRQKNLKNNRNTDQRQAESSSRQQSKPNRKENRQNSRQANKPRLSQDEQQHRAEKNLCFNCGYPGHRRDDCTYSFNPNRVVLRDDNQVKTQSLRGQKRQRVKAQPVHASDDDAGSVVHTTEDDSDYDEREIRPSKRSKN
jgi:Zinc knuckle